MAGPRSTQPTIEEMFKTGNLEGRAVGNGQHWGKWAKGMNSRPPGTSSGRTAGRGQGANLEQHYT